MRNLVEARNQRTNANVPEYYYLEKCFVCCCILHCSESKKNEFKGLYDSYICNKPILFDYVDCLLGEFGFM